MDKVNYGDYIDTIHVIKVVDSLTRCKLYLCNYVLREGGGMDGVWG